MTPAVSYTIGNMIRTDTPDRRKYGSAEKAALPEDSFVRVSDTVGERG